MIKKFNEHKQFIKFPQSEEAVDDICDKYYIRNYVMNSDFSIDVPDGVFLMRDELDHLPVKFSHVAGCFDCSDNFISSLEGCPIFVDGEFDCRNNQIFSLEGGPEVVTGDYQCAFNRLTNLKGSPESIERDFHFNNNKHLYTLEGCPKYVENSVYYGYCPVAEIINLFTIKSNPEMSTRNKKKILEFWNVYQPVFKEGSRWFVDDRRFRELYAHITGGEYKSFLQFMYYGVK